MHLYIYVCYNVYICVCVCVFVCVYVCNLDKDAECLTNSLLAQEAVERARRVHRQTASSAATRDTEVIHQKIGQRLYQPLEKKVAPLCMHVTVSSHPLGIASEEEEDFKC